MKTAFDLLQEAWTEVMKDYDVGKYSPEIDLQIKVNRLEEENKRLHGALEIIRKDASVPMSVRNIAVEALNPYEYRDNEK
jgi:hypothetical protein